MDRPDPLARVAPTDLWPARLVGPDAEVLRHDGEGRLLARCRDCGKAGPLKLDAATDAAIRRLCDRTGR